MHRQNRRHYGFKDVSRTDDHPNHEDCPSGAGTYCLYNARGETLKSHDEMKIKCHVSAEDSQKLFAVYDELTKCELLLHKCISGRTQNANESTCKSVDQTTKA